MEKNGSSSSSAGEKRAPSSTPLLCTEPAKNPSPGQSRDSEMKRESPSNRWRRSQDTCNDLWVWEISACIFSICCMAAVAGILFRLQDRPLSSWDFAIAPNSLVSIFATLSKSSMLLVVAECVSQMRWVHYQTGPHPLIDLDTFDAASRGPWGSFVFVLKMRGRPWLASLGCFLIIFALAIDPFTQQILSFPTRSIGIQDTNNTLSWIPYTQEVAARDKVNSDRTHSIWRASIGGLYDLNPQLTYGCASGNCSWPPFASFGYCSTCTDVTDTAKSECLQFHNNSEGCRTINYTMPDGQSLVIQNGSLNGKEGDYAGNVYTIIQAVANYAHSAWMDPRLVNVGIARLRGNGSRAYLSDDDWYYEIFKSGWEITACTVSSCAKVYEDVRSTNGVLSGNIPRDVMLVANNASGCWTGNNDGEVKSIGCNWYKPADPSELPAGTNTTFFAEIGPISIDQTSIFNLMNFDWNFTEFSDGGYVFDEDKTNLSLRLAKDLMVDENLSGTFKRIANSMTDYLRTSSSSRMVGGIMYVQETFVEVAWAWFTLPVALVLLAMVFLAASIAMSKRQRPGSLALWKSSDLPLLVYGVDGGWTVEEENKWVSQKGRRSAVEATLDNAVARLGVNKEEKLRFIRE